MPLQTATYANIRDHMQPGDIVAFGGKGNFSEIIKWATRSTVSHVGVILKSQPLISGGASTDYLCQIIESTSLNGFSGVAVSRLSTRLDSYSGEVWWLPLSQTVRKKLDGQKFLEFLLQQERKPYDVPQAVASALDLGDKLLPAGFLTHNAEDFSQFFCSELCAAALEAGGAIKKINASEVTPIDLCCFGLYQPDYFQLKGTPKAIKGHNSTNPEGWGE